MTKILKATAKVVLYKSKTLKDGAHPVAVRITFARRVKYYTVSRCVPSAWSEESHRFKKNKEANIKLNAYESKAQAIIESYTADGRPFSFRNFEKDFLLNADRKRVFQFLDDQIKKLDQQDRAGSLSIATTVRNSLFKFTNYPILTWSDIDRKFLTDYELHLSKTCQVNGISVYMRYLRALFNMAISEGLVKRELYPFYDYKIKSAPVKKRALSKAQIEALINYSAEEGSHDFHARNYFVLSYFLRGMNFIDLSRMKEENILDDRIQYIRSKTRTARSQGKGKIFSIPVRGLVRNLLAYYRKNNFTGSGFVLPILKKVYATTKAERWARAKILDKVNKSLQAICKELKFPDPDSVTFYSARHSWATITRREGARTEIIQEAMGHGDVKTTQVYLADFGDLDLDKADQHLDQYKTISIKSTG